MKGSILSTILSASAALLAVTAAAEAADRTRVRMVRVVETAPALVITRAPSELLARIPVNAGRYTAMHSRFGTMAALPCVPQYQWVVRAGYGPYNGLFTSVCNP